MNSTSHPLTPEEIVVLSREIQAMIAAGVPLDRGLQLASTGFPSRLESVSVSIAERLRQGQSLDQALRSEESVPAVYRAILAAGVRCGRSEEVLEEISELASHLLHIRQSLYLGFIYPAIVCVFGLLMLSVVVRSFVPGAISLYESLRIPVPDLLTRLAEFPAVPAAIGLMTATLIVGVLCFRSGGREVLVSGIQWIPGAGRLLTDVRLARMTSVLGLLVKNEVPLPEALRLTADTTTSFRWREQLCRLAESVETGEPLSAALAREKGVPAFLRWLISAGAEQSTLGNALRQASEHYRERAYARGELLKRVVPAAAMVLIGGGVTMLYALTVFGPMAMLWKTLGTP